MASAVFSLHQSILGLSTIEQKRLYLFLMPWIEVMSSVSGTQPPLAEIREKRFSKGLVCPHCGHTKIYRWGKFNGKQRYKCRGCDKTFNDLSLTPTAYSKHQDKWADMAVCLLEGLSIRKTATRLKIHVSTAFRWRHRLLVALDSLPKPVLSGVTESDETYFHYSEKGKRNLGRKPRKRGERALKRGLSKEQVCVLVARDRQDQTYTQVACMGQPTIMSLNSHLRPALAQVNVLCTDGASPYKRFCSDAKITHHPVKAKAHTSSSIYHIQNINAYHSRLKRWIGRFNGVATKYLQNYMEWFAFLDKTSRMSAQSAQMRILADACTFMGNPKMFTSRVELGIELSDKFEGESS